MFETKSDFIKLMIFYFFSFVKNTNIKNPKDYIEFKILDFVTLIVNY